jgi:hypothetical protein
LADHGSDGTVDGINPVVHALQINSWELGYYEYSDDTMQTTIRPVYIFDCTIFESNPSMPPVITSRDKVHVWADALPPVPEITSPPPGTCATPGELICFSGAGSGGITPLSYEWKDDVGGSLGSGSTLCAALPSPPSGHPQGDSVRVVQLTVRDGLGREGHASIDICLTPVTGVEPEAAARPLIGAVLPNPTQGSARVRVHAPVEGTYRLEVFDVSGRRVRSLDLRAAGPATLTFDWDGRTDANDRAAAGAYFARVTGPGESEVREIVRIR